MNGVVQSIWRYPIKGFTPEPLAGVTLTAGEHVPFDRLYAVEDGPSGFDPAAPAHISKQKFTVLAKIPAVALIRTAFDDETGVLTATAPGAPRFRAALTGEAGRCVFAAWLSDVLAGEIRGPLKVLPAPRGHRFMDDVEGFVSVINLASLRALERAVGRPVDPRRFRANLYVEGWPAWAEDGLAGGGAIHAGETELKVAKTITRCVATHVDPDTAEKDIEMVRALFENFGHNHLGVYASVKQGGRLALSDRISAKAALKEPASRVSPLSLFGLFTVSAMLICYALESRSHWFILGFAVACALGSTYGFLQGAWPFGLVEGVWTIVALWRWRTRPT